MPEERLGRFRQFLVQLGRESFLDWFVGIHTLGLLVFVCLTIALPIAWLMGWKPPSEIYYDKVQLQTNVLYSSARRWQAQRLEWLAQTDTGVTLGRDAPTQLSLHKRAFVFVHGHRSPQSEVAAYFSDLVDYIKEHAPVDSTFVVYDWPSVEPNWMFALGREESRETAERIRVFTANRAWSVADHQGYWERASYDLDQHYAAGIAVEGFVVLLDSLRRAGVTDTIVIAHSMGCHVVAESIRRHTASFADVNAIAFLAPDVSAGIFEDTTFLSGLFGVRQLHVFYSRGDLILSMASVVANWGRRLGAVGPNENSRIPPNVTVYDVTDRIAELPRIHSAYVRRDGAAKIDLHGVLTRSLVTEAASR